MYRIGEYEGFSLLITEMLSPSTESSLSKMVHSLNFCLFADQLPGYIELLFHCSLWLILGRMSIVQIIIAQMNCGLLSDNHKHSPDQRIHI